MLPEVLSPPTLRQPLPPQEMQQHVFSQAPDPMAMLDRVQFPRCGHSFHYGCLAKHVDKMLILKLDGDGPLWFQCPLCLDIMVNSRGGDMELLVNIMNGSGIEGCVDMIEDIKREYVNRDHPEEENKQAFLAWAGEGNVEQCTIFLDLGVDVDSAYEEGNMTALMMAVLNNRVGVVKLLIDRGADVNIKNSEWKTALDLAEERNRSAEIQNMLYQKMWQLQSTRDLEFRADHEEEVCMMEAEEKRHRFFMWAMGGSVEGCSYMVDEKVPVNSVYSIGNLTALMLAVLHDRADVVNFLVKTAGANVALKNSDGQTALDLAKQRNRSEEIIHILTQAMKPRHNPNLRSLATPEGISIVDISNWAMDERIMSFLGWATAGNVYGWIGGGTLMRAVMKGRVEIVKPLVRRGADVNRKNAEGKSALDLAEEKGAVSVVLDGEKMGSGDLDVTDVPSVLDNGRFLHASSKPDDVSDDDADAEISTQTIPDAPPPRQRQTARRSRGRTRSSRGRSAANSAAEDNSRPPPEIDDIWTPHPERVDAIERQECLLCSRNFSRYCYYGNRYDDLTEQEWQELVWSKPSHPMGLLDRVQLPLCGHSFHYGCLAKHIEKWNEDIPPLYEYLQWFQCPVCREFLVISTDGISQVFVNVMNGSGMVGRVEMVEDVLKEVWNRDHAEKAFKDAFLAATKLEDIEECVLLLDEGADVNSIYEPGHQTSLMLAVLKNNVEFVKFLVEHGADVRITDENGKTALDVAVEHNCSRKIHDIFSPALWSSMDL
ncbi:hypothetical protein HK102_001759 [Quaeritorhiza haematococci]|nr:hypothetical protein HK102_001759 [Quaeritorhiza haematococci]